MTTQFQDLNLNPNILKSLAEAGYSTPTPIQAQAIPHLLEGRDLLGCAQTGTGKTAAFALPILHHLSNQKVGPFSKPRLISKHARCLVLTPTRELALQIYENFKIYGKYLNLKSAVIFGGVGQGQQVQSIRQGLDVLIATPGRLLDLINQKHLSLSAVEIFVLDEADRMLDMGFIQDVKRAIQLLPERRQNLFFSATMPPEIAKLSEQILKNAVRVVVAPVSSTAEKIDQELMFVERKNKSSLLLQLMQNPSLKRVIVFTRTKHGANRVCETLSKNRIESRAIHGNKSQSARQKALLDFKDGKARVLVATDIAARGIDIDQISHVINFEIPHVSESYVHRIGRTARAGHSGAAISFCDHEEKALARDIEKLIGQPIPVNRDHKYHSESVENAATLSKGKAKSMIDQQNGRKFSRPKRNRRPRPQRRD